MPRGPVTRSLLAALPLLALLAAGCAPGDGPPAPETRDWSAHPAVVESGPVDVLYALSDVHGGYDRAIALLAGNGVIEPALASPAEARWTAGQATLVVIGDLFDKGPQGLEVIDLFRALQASAEGAGGHVIVLMGNHEAEFLADPENKQASRADGIDQEIREQGLRPYDVASRADPRGRFLRDLPFAARVGDWFFLHSGDSRGRTIAELSGTIRAAIDGQGYGSLEIVGPDSFLESIGWFRASASIGQTYAGVLGVQHIVFGHDPGGIGDSKKHIGVDADAVLFRIDCGLSPNIDYSDGKLLRVRRESGMEIAESLTPDAIAVVLHSGPI
ncbi:MAG: metallophosphoesterase [Byssovorax sp.]